MNQTMNRFISNPEIRRMDSPQERPSDSFQNSGEKSVWLFFSDLLLLLTLLLLFSNITRFIHTFIFPCKKLYLPPKCWVTEVKSTKKCAYY